MCFQTLQNLVQKAEHIFVRVPYGFLLLCIPPSTVVGSRVLQSYFAHCQGADRFGSVLLDSKLPLVGLVFEEDPGGHVGNALGSCVGPLLVPVNENIIKISIGDVTVD